MLDTHCFSRVGQDCLYTPCMTVYFVVFLPKIPYMHRVYMVLANPMFSSLKVRTHKCTSWLNAQPQARVHMQAHVHMHACTHTHTHTYTHSFVAYTRKQAHVYVRASAYYHIYLHIRASAGLNFPPGLARVCLINTPYNYI